MCGVMSVNVLCKSFNPGEEEVGHASGLERRSIR